MNQKILVDQSSVRVPLSKEFERECGEFIISRFNQTSHTVKSFTFNDIAIIRCPQDKINGTTFAKLLRENIPLDAYCAAAIFSKKIHLDKLGELIRPYWWKKEFKKITVCFLGSFAADETNSNRPHVYCFKYEDPHTPPLFMTYENESSFSSNEDLAIVFKPKFIKKVQSELRLEEIKAKREQKK
jgi:hypothetical protein